MTTQKQHALLLALFLFFGLPCNAQIFESAEQAFEESSRSCKPVLLIFSGSDWCAPCIQLERKILTEETFTAFAENQLVILKADFPQRKRIAKTLQLQNESLAERYNAKGIFPFVVLLNQDGSVQGVLKQLNHSPAELIAEIQSYLLRIKNGKT